MFGRLTPMVRNLLLVTVAAYLIPSVLGFRDINLYVGLWHIQSPYFMPFQFLTYMFAHGGFGHIFFNMLGLFFLGPLLEQFWGPKRFLTFYLITGIGAGVLYTGIKYVQSAPIKSDMETYEAGPSPEAFDMFMSDHASDRTYYGLQEFIESYYENPRNSMIVSQSMQEVQSIYWGKINVPMVGASGAIYGILMAFGLLFPNMQLMLLFPPIPIKAKYLAMGLGAIAIYSGFRDSPGDNVAHFAHLGGMAFAFIMIHIWRPKK